MRSPIWSILLLAAGGSAQLTTVTECEAYSYTGTSTFTEYTTYYTTADGIGGARPPTSTSLRTSLTSFTLPFASTSTGDSYTDGGIGGSRSTTRSTLSTTTSFTSSVIGNGTSLLIPGDDEPVTPNTPIPTSVTTTSRTSTLTSTSSSSGLSTSASSDATSSTSSTSSTTESSSTTSDSTTSDTDSSSTTTNSATTTDSTTSTSTTTTVASSTTSSLVPLVTDQAYIDTVIRHHNRHRLNHTAPDLTWDPALAATAKKIADGCVYAHDTKTDCPTYDTESCYGQNIGAGYLPVQMGYLISDGFYNSEVNYYTYYGGEPDTATLHEWGHFSQIVWVDTGSVGCYTSDCTATGLANIAASTGIRPFFTVCNYAPPGNYIDEFADNVLSPIPLDTIHAGYQCPTDENCVDGSV